MGGIFVGILFPFLRCDFRFSSRSMPMGEGIGKLMALKPAISRDETGNRALYGMVLPPSAGVGQAASILHRSEEHTSELQSLMRSSYAVFCLKKKKIVDKEHNEHFYNA